MGLQPQLRLKQDIATRWHSTYFMMRRFTEVKEPLISTLALVNTQLTALSLEEWKIINEACEVLQPFEEVTVELSSERFVADSKAILMARGLQRVTAHRQRRSSIHKPVREMINILMAELTKRFGGIEQVNVLVEAVILDLRFKKTCIHS
ncbi:Zinc finger BED domain-containing protein 4 [Chionoecetes opilio]|uniref:Zinc finger BED domain-containing protein 4 n=1 Tax=Chionoecetes opilio TaxID=41210 RepID=A0A8J8WE89_CHIOP|nr:Zinc finger BED domain-containing protein 4 [Chionoecetes opilio]